jgi:hypothetical protein
MTIDSLAGSSNIKGHQKVSIENGSVFLFDKYQAYVIPALNMPHSFSNMSTYSRENQLESPSCSLFFLALPEISE